MIGQHVSARLSQFAKLILKVSYNRGADLMACLAAVAESLRKFSKVNNALQKSNAAAARIFETLSVPVERPRE